MTAIITLPYSMDAFIPHISGETLCFIHQKIMPKLVAQITLPKDTSLMTYLIQHADNSVSHRSVTELYNHNFWLSHISPTKNTPRPLLMEAILHSFGSMDKLTHELHKAATHPDNRWLWLVCQNDKPNKLTVVATSCHALDKNLRPIAVCNLWQHAYYLDYRHRTDDYINTYLTHLIDWHAAERAWVDEQHWLPVGW